MVIKKKIYKYKVEYIKDGKWVAIIETDFEELRTFDLVANADETYQYRILCHGEDVTQQYKKKTEA